MKKDKKSGAVRRMFRTKGCWEKRRLGHAGTLDPWRLVIARRVYRQCHRRGGPPA